MSIHAVDPSWRVGQRWLAVATLALLAGSCETPSSSVQPAVGRIEVEPIATSVGVGNTTALTARVLDAEGNVVGGQSVFWSTQNASIATVSQAGVVTGVVAGTVQIAASLGGRSGISAVTVTPRPVTTVRMTPGEANVATGKTVQIVAEALDGSGAVVAGRTVTWSSSTTTVATVSGTGVVTGVAPGTASVRATIDGVQGTTVVVVVPVAVAQVRVTPNATSVPQGDFVQLSAVTLDAAGNTLTGRVVTWSSSNQSVAVVSSTGRVQSVSPGSATITAASEGVQGTAVVTVTLVPVASVTISPANPTVVVGQTAALSAIVRDAQGNVLNGRTVTWSSGNTAIASVNSSGVVTGVATGSTQITATSSGVVGTTTVTVSAVPVASVQVTPATPSVNVGQTVQLTATARDAQGNILSGRVATWTTNNPSVATVSGTGLVTGVAVGASTVTATIGGTTGTATVTVTAVPIATITVTPNPTSVEEKQTLQLTATARDANGNVLTGRTIVWSSSDNAIAAVSQSGVVTGIAPGATTVIASSPGGGSGGSSPSGSASLTVTYAPVSTVQVVPTTASVNVNGTVSFTANLFDAVGQPLSPSGRTIAWSSLDPAKATVNQSTGVATGVSAGTTTIRATASSPGQGSAQHGDATLTVANVPVASVSVTPSTATVHAGALYARQFTAVTRDAQGNVLTGRSIIWTSSNQSAATVDQSSGVVTGVATGTTNITATSEGVAGSASVTVDLVAVVNLIVAPPSATISAPATLQLGATPQDSAGNTVSGAALGGRTVSWTTSKASVATVSSSGLVTGVAGGTATITGTMGTVSGASDILVLGPVSAVALTISPDSLILPGTLSGTVTVTDAASNPLPGKTVTLTSSATSVATVAPSSSTTNASGQVTVTITGVAGGSSTITAASSGKNGTKVVRMLRPVNSVTVAPGTNAILVGGTVTLTVTARDVNNTALAGRPCTIVSSDPNIVTVSPASGVTNSSGRITVVATGVAKGTVSVTATCETKSGTATVVVS